MVSKNVSLGNNETLTYDYGYEETNSFLIRGATLEEVPHFIRPYIITYFEDTTYILVSLECTEDKDCIFKLPNGIKFVFDNPNHLFKKVEAN